jgi:hypothetical protein
MLISEKIILFMSLWIAFSIIITNESQIEIFFILILFGFVIIKEIANPFIIGKIKLKLNLFILFFLIIFSIVIVNRIIEYLNA